MNHNSKNKKGDSTNVWIAIVLAMFLINALSSFNDGNISESGIHLNAVLIIVIGRSLYLRTKNRMLEIPVKGSKIIEYVELLFLLLSFPTYFINEGYLRWPLNFVAVMWSLSAYFYLVIKNKREVIESEK